MTYVNKHPTNNPQETLAEHYTQCFLTYGPTHQGVDWPTSECAEQRYAVMADVWKEDSRRPLDILDLGCGFGGLLDYLAKNDSLKGLSYTGIDLSSPMIEYARSHYSGHIFQKQDILETPLPQKSYDYVVMNGLFTEKQGLSHQAMWTFAQDMIKAAFQACRRGIVFNVMNAHVDYCRLDLFHMPLDPLVNFLSTHCSRNITIRSNYGLYEYTVYVYRDQEEILQNGDYLVFHRLLAKAFRESSLKNQFLNQWNEMRFTSTQRVFYAKEDGEAIAICVASPPEAGVGTIFWVLVDTNYQGKGVGSRLLEEACEAYRNEGVHKVKLTAPTARARDFYLKNGFLEEGYHPTHWWNHEFWSLARILEEK